MSSLAALIADLAAGRVTVVDLTQPLGPETPVIGLPPIFAASPGVSIDTISRYDDKGPAWYWNTIRMGEHTGTHFDAPVHWISGRDRPNNTTDTIPAGQFIGPGCVIDITSDVAANEDYLLDVAGLERWESHHGRVPRGYWLLLRTGWSRRASQAFLNARRTAWPRLRSGDIAAAHGSGCAGRGRRDDWHRCGTGGKVRSAVPNTTSCTATGSGSQAAISIAFRRLAPS